MVTRDVSTLLAFALVGALIPCAACAESAVRGMVRDGRNGGPLVGASVSLMQPSKKDQAEIRFQDLTKEDGTFSIGGVPAGKYAVTVLYPELKPAARPEVTVKDGEDAVLDFSLSTY